MERYILQRTTRRDAAGQKCLTKRFERRRGRGDARAIQDCNAGVRNRSERRTDNRVVLRTLDTLRVSIWVEATRADALPVSSLLRDSTGKNR